MPRGYFAAIVDRIRRRVAARSPHQPGPTDDYRPTHDEERTALARHNDAEANVGGRTLAETNGIRAFGKGRPR